jgi:hypothetical protein
MAGAGTELGLDRSGNGNNFSASDGTLGSDQTVNSPTNNFATLDPLSSGAGVFSEANLKYVSTADTGNPTLGISSGKAYAEVLVLSDASNTYIGVCDISQGLSPTRGGNWTSHGAIAYKFNGDQYKLAVDGGSSTTASYNGASYTNGDIIGVAIDVDSDTITFYKNGSSQGNAADGPSYLSSNGVYSILIYAGGTNFICNFGQDSSFAGNKTAQGNQDSNEIGDFYYAPPAGFLALCTENLPEPTLDPKNHFNTVLYTGNGSTQSITGVGFQPDFTWIKERTSTSDHSLHDVVRGSTEIVKSSTTAAEISRAASITSFDTDGFSLGDNAGVNENTQTYASWNWKAGNANTAFSESGNNPAGTHRANVPAGFSIVSYTGTGAAGTVAHGLGAAPEWIFIKNRDVADAWAVYYGDNTDYLVLNTNAATVDNATYWNDTSPTSSVFTVNTDHSVNADGEKYIAYCWHSVEGYSKIGTYTGNGDANGPFVYTGFRPSCVFFKGLAISQWAVKDIARNPNNEMAKALLPNLANATETNREMDFTSNGFKQRDATSGDLNDDGTTYIYMAFAETPFKYANAK